MEHDRFVGGSFKGISVHSFVCASAWRRGERKVREICGKTFGKIPMNEWRFSEYSLDNGE